LTLARDDNPTPAPQPDPPEALKLLAWQGVGLWVGRNWDVGRYQGDGDRGSFRVDGEDRIMAQVQWWRARGPIPPGRLAEQLRRHLRTDDRPAGDRDTAVIPTDRVRLPGRLGAHARAFVVGPVARGQLRPTKTTDVLIHAHHGRGGRTALWRFVVEDGWPGMEGINRMAEGLMLFGADGWRDWAVLDFHFRSPPGAALAESSLSSGVCLLRFVWPGGRVAVRRFSAANAVMGRERPDVDHLVAWCRAVYAREFYDMKYRVDSAAAGGGVHRLHLVSQKSRWLAPLEFHGLLPRHRKSPREIEIFWGRSVNKIWCFEIARRTDRNRDSIGRMIDSYRTVSLGPSDGEEAGPAEASGRRSGRRRSLEARVLPSEKVSTEWTQEGLARLQFAISRRPALRALRILGSLPSRPATETRTVELDLIGSMIWRCCDGRTRVCDIIRRVRQDFLISYHEAERSVTEYVRTLGSRGLIRLEMPAK
jgi:hypothetical protein